MGQDCMGGIVMALSAFTFFCFVCEIARVFDTPRFGERLRERCKLWRDADCGEYFNREYGI